MQSVVYLFLSSVSFVWLIENYLGSTHWLPSFSLCCRMKNRKSPSGSPISHQHQLRHLKEEMSCGTRIMKTGNHESYRTVKLGCDNNCVMSISTNEKICAWCGAVHWNGEHEEMKVIANEICLQLEPISYSGMCMFENHIFHYWWFTASHQALVFHL
jgi:hypothetical protein